MAKKSKQAKENDQLTLSEIKVGNKILDLHDEEIEITEDLIEQMKQYEQETKKSVIWRNAITGSFLFWKMNGEKPKKKKKAKKPKKVKAEEIEAEELEFDEEMEQAVEVNKLDELIETELEEEEELSEIIMEAYKEKYNVQTVKRESKKFRDFAEKYRESE